MIFGFRGNMRGGKTLSMTMWGLFLANTTHQEIYANYTLASGTRFEKWRELNDVRNSIILFDEIGTAMDSRNFKSADQIYFTHLFAQMGKLGNTLMYTTQREHSVEKRIRDNTDYFIHCERLWPGADIRQIWLDTQASIEAPIKVREYIIRPPNAFYPLYDSFEVVRSRVHIEK